MDGFNYYYFNQIEKLKWLPWIGDHFNLIPQSKKILIIGESHYHDNTPQSIKKHDSLYFTREIIKELAIQRCYYSTRMFPNLHKALFRNDTFDSYKFWHLVSFYNFIQRPLNTNKGRPSYDDFYNSWTIFFKVIKMLKPDICLFVGTSAAYSLNDAIQNTDLTIEDFQREDFISNAYAKTAKLKSKDKNESRLIFIRHTSKMFSWRKWNDYLLKKIPSELSWLREQVNT